MLPEKDRVNTKSDLKRFLNAELVNHSAKKKWIPFTESSILSRHTKLLRKSEYHLNNHHRIRFCFNYFRLIRIQNKYGMHIPLNCCDEGLNIVHLGQITINCRATLGKNVSLHVNSGVVAGGTGSDVPTLKDGVVLGIGSIVLGNVVIEENVAVGANAVVNKSVLEKNVGVAGVPAKIISNNGRIQWGKN